MKNNLKEESQRLQEEMGYKVVDSEEIEKLIDEYLPEQGEGENFATQVVTAYFKLNHEWYNNGNTITRTCNNTWDYANWLYNNIPQVREILDEMVNNEYSETEYEKGLKELEEELINRKNLEEWSKQPKVGTIYKNEEPFKEACRCEQCGEYISDQTYDFNGGICDYCASHNEEDEYDEEDLEENVMQNKDIRRAIMNTLNESSWQKLLTKRELDLFKKYPIGSQAGLGMEARVLCKFFNPMGVGTWIIIEAEPEGDSWNMYGYADLGYGYELGFIPLRELEEVRLPFGMKIERDMYSVDNTTKVKDLIDESELMY